MADYKYAAQHKLRFASNRGNLVVEQLFQLELEELDIVARTVHTELESLGKQSFINTKTNDPRKKQLEVSLDIVKDVIATKEAAKDAAENRTKKLQLRTKLLEAIEAKENEKLTTSSIDDLKKQLDELEAA
jgi:hypothetical protein